MMTLGDISAIIRRKPTLSLGMIFLGMTAVVAFSIIGANQFLRTGSNSGDKQARDTTPSNVQNTDGSNSNRGSETKKSEQTKPVSTPSKPSAASPAGSTPGTTPATAPSTQPAAGPSGPAQGSCTGAQHTPGGPDGFGGCWPYAGNTGVPSGTVLSAYTGPCTITIPNTVINAKTINCGLSIRAANVQITNSQVNGPLIVDSNDCGTSYSYSVTDSTIHVSDINYRGLLYCNYTATRVEVTGGQSMAWCENCTIQDSYLHSPLEDPAGAAANQAAHNSTVRVARNATIKHNTLWCQVKEYYQPDGQDSSGCSANQTAYSHDGSPPSNSTLERNLYMPTTGGYCAYGGSTAGALSSVNNIVFKDNIFKRGTTPGDRGQYECGYYGAITSFDASRPGNQWINNRYDDGTLLLP